MTLQTLERPEVHTEEPDWEGRPWTKPMMWAAPMHHPNKSLLATCDFTYYGLKIRGLRVLQGQNGVFVKIPSKQFGERVEDVFYFTDKSERELFTEDVLWVYHNGVGKRRAEREAAEQK